MTTCIPKEIIQDLKDKGIFDEVNSVKREQLFRQFFTAEDARYLNLKFEKTKLLKKTELAFDRMVNKLDISLERKLELIQEGKDEIARKKNLINTLQDLGEIKDKDIINIEKMANDIYKKKYNLTISKEQTDNILKLTNEVTETSKLPKMPNGDYDPIYGLALDDLNLYTNNIKDPKGKMKLGELISTGVSDIKKEFNSLKGTGSKIAYVSGKVWDTITSSSTFKTVKATLDASFIGIQGLGAATRNPLAAMQATRTAFNQMFATDPILAMKSFRANLFSKKYYNDGVASGLRIMKPEEQMTSNLVEKLGWFGKAVERADNGFSAFLQKIRYDEFERVVKIQEIRLGRTLDINNPVDAKLLKEAASHANKISGTSNLGKAEMYANAINEVTFAGRYAVSDIRMFTDVLDFTGTADARKRALRTLALNIGTLYGTYLGIAALNPDNTEIRPTATNFMKYKTDDGEWVGVKLKGQWIIQLISRLFAGNEINAKGKKTVYGKGYKGKTWGDAAGRVARGKLAPIPSVLIDIAQGKDFVGNKATAGRVLRNLALPISTSSIIDRAFNENEDVMYNLKYAVYDTLGLSAYNLKK